MAALADLLSWRNIAGSELQPAAAASDERDTPQQTHACDTIQQRVWVKWEGGGIDCWAPGTISKLVGNEMTVKYDPEMNARVQKVDVIDVGTLEHRREVIGSNNPSSRLVKAWLLESHTDHGVLAVDGSHIIPVAADSDGDGESDAGSSVSSIDSDDADDNVPLRQRAKEVKAAPPKKVPNSPRAAVKRVAAKGASSAAPKGKGAPKRASAAPKGKGAPKRASPEMQQTRKSKRTAAQMAKIQLEAGVASEDENSSDHL